MQLVHQYNNQCKSNSKMIIHIPNQLPQLNQYALTNNLLLFRKGKDRKRYQNVKRHIFITNKALYL